MPPAATPLVTFRDQVMRGEVPIGYKGLVVVPEPGVVHFQPSNSAMAGVARTVDVDAKRVAYLMRDPKP